MMTTMLMNSIVNFENWLDSRWESRFLLQLLQQKCFVIRLLQSREGVAMKLRIYLFLQIVAVQIRIWRTLLERSLEKT